MKIGKVVKWLVICLVLVAFGYYVAPVIRGLNQRAHNEREIPVCSENLRELQWALGYYADAHGGRLPSADKWCDQLLPYVKDRSVFVCPAARNQVCSYALNRKVAGMRFADLEGSANAKLIVLFESDAGWNATGGQELLPIIPRHQPYPENARPLPATSSNFYNDILFGYRVKDASGRPLRQYMSKYIVWSPIVRSE
jgi:hypothetical protein